ncbi:MAG TPA: c-type cytochrome domain-containing protein [Kofleriaceae bacterium]|jgi:hypothetical protein
MPWRSCSALLATVAFAGCGTTPDDRPQTFEYITLEVLAPACGTVACHSTTTREHGYAFDTLDAAQVSLGQLVTPGHADSSQLYDVITRTNGVMPPDSPLADEDIALIGNWIDAGAPGL